MTTSDNLMARRAEMLAEHELIEGATAAVRRLADDLLDAGSPDAVQLVETLERSRRALESVSESLLVDADDVGAKASIVADYAEQMRVWRLRQTLGAGVGLREQAPERPFDWVGEA